MIITAHSIYNSIEEASLAGEEYIEITVIKDETDINSEKSNN